MAQALTISDLACGYGAIQVLNKLSLHVEQSEIVTIIGANGAGKSTLLHAISGITPISAGTITFKGEVLSDLPAHLRVARGLAQVPEGRKIFPRLSVRENLELGAWTRTNRSEIEDDYAKMYELFPVLKDRSSQAGGTLSGGEQQMLALGRALMSRPSMLLLDEPSMGIAPILVEKIFQAILKLNQEGMTILLVEQNAHMALQIAHRAYVLETGSIIIEDKASNLLDDPRIKESYLGD